MAMVNLELDCNKGEEEERFHGLPPLKRFKILEKEKQLRHVQVCSLPAKKRVFAFKGLNFLEDDDEEDKENMKLYSNNSISSENFRWGSEFCQVLQSGCNREVPITIGPALESRKLASKNINSAEKKLDLKRKEGCMTDKAPERKLKKHSAVKRNELIDLNFPAPEACVAEERLPALLNCRTPSSSQDNSQHLSNKRPVDASAVLESKNKNFSQKHTGQEDVDASNKSFIEPKISASKSKLVGSEDSTLCIAKENIQRAHVSPSTECPMLLEAQKYMAEKMSSTETITGLGRSENVKTSIAKEIIQEIHAFAGSDSRNSVAEKVATTQTTITGLKQSGDEYVSSVAKVEVSKPSASPNSGCTFGCSEAKSFMAEKVSSSAITITVSEARTSTLTIDEKDKCQMIAASSAGLSMKDPVAMVVEALTSQNLDIPNLQSKASTRAVVLVEDFQKSEAADEATTEVLDETENAQNLEGNPSMHSSVTNDSVALMIEEVKSSVTMEIEVQKSFAGGSDIDLFDEAGTPQKLETTPSIDVVNQVKESCNSLSISSEERTDKTVTCKSTTSNGHKPTEPRLLVAAPKQVNTCVRKSSASKVNQTSKCKNSSFSTHEMAKFSTVKLADEEDIKKVSNPCVPKVNECDKCKKSGSDCSELKASVHKKENAKGCLKRVNNISVKDSTENLLKHNISDKSCKDADENKSERQQKSQPHGNNGKTEGHAKVKKCTPIDKCQGLDKVPNCAPAEKSQGHTLSSKRVPSETFQGHIESGKHVPSEKLQGRSTSKKHLPKEKTLGSADQKNFVSAEKCEEKLQGRSASKKHLPNEKTLGSADQKNFVSAEKCEEHTGPQKCDRLERCQTSIPIDSPSVVSNESAKQTSEVKEATRADALEANIEQEDDDGIFCDVCREADADPSDPIVFCDGCDVMVHASCYGYPLMDGIPSGDWFCRQCEWEKRKPKSGAGKARICCLCPNSKGAMKKTTGGAWAHLSCALFVPEVYYKKAKDREGIEVGSVPSWRWDLPCSVCGGKQGTGACIQCTEIGCSSTFHVSCALDAGLTIDYRNGNTSTKTPAIVIAFCDSHSGHLSTLEKRHFKIVPRV